MINKLTSEMELMAIAVKQKWLRQFEIPTLNPDEAKVLIKELYVQAGRSLPEVIVARSPLDAQHIHHWLNTSKRKAKPSTVSLEKIIDLDLRNQSNLRSEIWSHLGEEFGAMSKSLGQAISTKLRGTLKAMLWDPVDAIGAISICHYTRILLIKEMKKTALPYSEVCFHLGMEDWGLIALYDYAAQMGWCDLEKLRISLGLAMSGVYSIIPLEGICIVAPNPKTIELNEEMQLSRADGMAVEWEDGFGFYCWNGHMVEERLIIKPDSFTRQDILLETNAERRRIIQERIGAQHFAALLGLQEVDSDKDLKGNKQSLYRTREPDNITGQYIYFAKVTCPTTNREYFLCVPPGLNNVWDAVAWTFGRTKDTYNPIHES